MAQSEAQQPWTPPVAGVLDSCSGRGYLGRDLVRRSGTTCVGPASTVRLGVDDNLAIHRAVETVPEGSVLVVSAPSLGSGFLGEVLVVALLERGVRGLVTDGSIRDVDELRALGFPVWSRGVCPVGTVKQDPGDVDQEIDIAGVQVRPGDIVVGDGDGVVVVPAGEWGPIEERARAKAEVEAAWFTELRAGRSLSRLSGFLG